MPDSEIIIKEARSISDLEAIHRFSLRALQEQSLLGADAAFG